MPVLSSQRVTSLPLHKQMDPLQPLQNRLTYLTPNYGWPGRLLRGRQLGPATHPATGYCKVSRSISLENLFPSDCPRPAVLSRVPSPCFLLPRPSA